MKKDKITNRNCFVCGAGFYDEPKQHRVCCSRKCSGQKQRKRITIQCKMCQKEFYCYSNNKRPRKYCSSECYHESLKTLDKYKSKICLYCNKSFTSKENSKLQIVQNKYCSSICRRNHQRILQKTGSTKICIYCNEEFYTKRCNTSFRCCSQKCASKSTIGKFYPKRSIARANLIASGKFNPKRNFYKQGYYTSTITGIKEWFGSSYEERRMKQLDNMKVMWTKRHGIRIPYTDPKGNIRNYVPDFLVDSIIIEEVKPSTLIKSIVDNNNLKYDAAVDFCSKNGYQYRIITEKDLSV